MIWRYKNVSIVHGTAADQSGQHLGSVGGIGRLVALAIWLEQKYEWANKVTGCILALVFMLVLANVGIVPTDAPVYDHVWDYVVPLAVPMLLSMRTSNESVKNRARCSSSISSARSGLFSAVS